MRDSVSRQLLFVPVLLELGECPGGKIAIICAVLEPGIACVYAWFSRHIVSDQFQSNAQFLCEAQFVAIQNPIGRRLHAIIERHGTAMKWHHLCDRIPFSVLVHEYLLGIGKVNKIHNAVTNEILYAHTLNKVGVADCFALGLLWHDARRLGAPCQNQNHA